jgi:3-isopropylmalate dehydratase small subunit
MTGIERLKELGYKLTLSSEFSDIFERNGLASEKNVIVFDKQSFQILVQTSIDGEEVASFLPNDVYVSIFKHSTELGW